MRLLGLTGISAVYACRELRAEAETGTESRAAEVVNLAATVPPQSQLPTDSRFMTELARRARTRKVA